MDRIEKKRFLRAPRERVWRAISDSREFGLWFGLRAEGPFLAGTSVKAVIVPTLVNPDVAEAQKPHEGMAFELLIERVEPPRLLSFRWAVPGAPGDKPVMTLVTFTLEDQNGGTLLTIEETGFEALPADLAARAFADNDSGWTMQIQNVELYVTSYAQGQ
ncbi:MAG: SRPBCC family protein [Bryobacteraceae bacterium]|nr:SRPBCC family protein [Bryobacteraceae bacterium]